MKIVGIHGIGNHRPGEVPETAARNLSAAWSRHLGAEVEVVYYADLLRDRGGQSDDASDLEDLTEAEEETVRELLGAQPAASSPGRVPQGLLTAVLRDGIADLAESWACPEWLMEWFMVRFAKEVAAYQRRGPARDAVQQRLREALDRHRPDVLIAHSLGSVVAYETLYHDGTPPVPLWVTVGSPLALPKAIFDRLHPSPEAGRGARPPQVVRWANLADPGDPVAIPVKGVSQRFAGVDSDEHHVVHQGFKFHHAESYLKSAGLAHVLTTAA
ncbi:serine peptidase [Streptomyces sp. A1499]|uniref:serine peptidase n=1 Tax=Streptomyces sp. A1499 TaxID=2563104 RepID=UPI00109E749B|nr:serine peptidase [Streptomyces sp. A1499]THC40890.1 serine peptidase [Streptomyces sp. A1499]